MQCIRPIKAGFDRNGDITYSNKRMSKELESFAFPCRKCLPCRLNTAREKAIRVLHESTIHKNSIFLTLTYNDENVGDGRLNYRDFQLFIMRLREHIERDIQTKEAKELLKISYMVTGEYGDLNKRPHWHVILFNYLPHDERKKRVTDRNERIFTSKFLTNLWGKGNIEYGSVTIDSAGYVARYAAKKLTHGQDQNHDYHPIHKTSSKHAIGKRYIEKNWQTVFHNGYVTLPNNQKAAIPRYYVDWLKKHHMNAYTDYYRNVKLKTIALVQEKNRKEELEYLSECALHSQLNNPNLPIKKQNVKLTILKQKFKKLQERLKL